MVYKLTIRSAISHKLLSSKENPTIGSEFSVLLKGPVAFVKGKSSKFWSLNWKKTSIIV